MDYRCKPCGYFLLTTDLTEGSVRVVCRRCRKSQRVQFGQQPGQHHHFGTIVPPKSPVANEQRKR